MSFVECLKYIESIVRLTALKREDDIVTIMREQKWNLANNAKQIQAAQKDCLASQRRDDLTMPPFQGPIGKYPRLLPKLSNKNGKLPIDIENDLSNKIFFVFRHSITFDSFMFAMFYFFPS